MKVLYSIVNYNGPVCGIIENEGVKLWFQCLDTTSSPCIFNVYSLSEESLSLVEEEHKRFQEELGYFMDHDPKIHNNYRKNTEMVKFKHLDYQKLEKTLIQQISESELEHYYPPRDFEAVEVTKVEVNKIKVSYQSEDWDCQQTDGKD